MSADDSIADKLETVRIRLGMEDREAFWKLTLSQVAEAAEREPWCGKGHGGHRDASCVVCNELSKRGT